MNYDPEVFFELMYGHPAHKPEPAEFVLFRKVETELLDSLESQGSAVVRQLALLASQANLVPYLQYAFFIFVERQRDWPAIPPKQRHFLVLGKNLMSDGGWTPNYSDRMQVPDDLDIDKAVDKLLVDLAIWCQKDMGWQITRTYVSILAKHAPTFAKFKPEVPKNIIQSGLDTAFRQLLRKAPGVFQRPDFAHGVVELIMP